MPLSFFKPEYVFRPSQLPLRIYRTFQAKNVREASVVLPWHKKIYFHPNETIGKSIWHLGVYELPLSELLYRSLNNTSHFCDIGANIGYMSSIACAKITNGSIYAFEPNPLVLPLLKKNIAQWNSSVKPMQIDLFTSALGDQPGQADLYLPEYIEPNEGIASLANTSGKKVASVRVERLDLVLDPHKKWTIKIDVEGFELNVLKGAEKLLKNQTLETIFYEDHEPYPNQTSQYLESFSYQIFRIGRDFGGPKLLPASSQEAVSEWEPTNYLATAKPLAQSDDLFQSGWSILRL